MAKGAMHAGLIMQSLCQEVRTGAAKEKYVWPNTNQAGNPQFLQEYLHRDVNNSGVLLPKVKGRIATHKTLFRLLNPVNGGTTGA